MASNAPSALRAIRLEHGLTQAELAERAGVSRQLVAAVEAGQNTPAVDAALRLAHALGSTVEDLFLRGGDELTPALDDDVPGETPLRIGRVGDTLIAAELPDSGAAAGGWGAADGIVVDGRLRLFARSNVERFVIAGCEPALGLAEAMLTGRGASSLLALSAPTDTALRSLAKARVHAAVVHGPAGELPSPPVSVIRMHLAGWRVGLGVAPALAAPTLEAVLESDVTIVQRGPAAASQQALARAAGRCGRTTPEGPQASGHIDAARQASIRGCAAVSTEAAAHAFGLRFIAIEPHTVEIWIAEQWAHHPGLQSLGELLASRAFTDRIAALGGYDLAGAGTLVATG